MNEMSSEIGFMKGFHIVINDEGCKTTSLQLEAKSRPHAEVEEDEHTIGNFLLQLA